MAIEEQHIRIKAILEVVGKPREYVENMLKEYVDKIKEDDTLMAIKDNVSQATEDNKVWSSFAEMEIVIKGMTNLVSFCINYMPSSIEIIKPENFSFDCRVFTGFVNDMLSKLHSVDLIVKQVNTKNINLLKNMDKIVTNNIVVLLKLGINTKVKLSQATGINESDIDKLLERLVKNDKIKRDANIFSLV